MKLLLSLLLTSALICPAFAQNALQFDGIDDHAIAPTSGPTGTMNRTVEAWVKMDALITTQIVVVNWGDMAIGQRFTLNIIDGFPRIEIGGEGVSSATAMSVGAWHHLAATYDQLSSTPYKLYLDGTLVASAAFGVPINTSNVNGITIGRRVDGINHFIGSIDEVRVWNYARLQAQISGSMNSEFCGPEPGLIAYYKFNQGMAGGNNAGITTLLDATASQNHATLTGFTLNGATSNWVAGKTLAGDSFSNQIVNACNSYTSPSGQYLYTATGVYSDTIANALGCDSVITIDLTIVQLDTTITQFGAALQSNQGNATYQWLDCNNGNSPVPGATSQTFFPTVNGSYAVAVTLSGCTDTSICYPVLNVGVNDPKFDTGIIAFPNPVQNILHIEMNASQAAPMTIEIIDAVGRIKMVSRVQANMNGGLITDVDVNSLPQGLYFIRLKENPYLRTRFVKQ